MKSVKIKVLTITLFSLIFLSISPPVIATETLILNPVNPYYFRGDTVIISGCLTENGMGIPSVFIGITVKDSGNIDLFTDQVQTNATGYFTTNFIIPPSASLGLCTIFAAYGAERENTTFQIIATDIYPPIFENTTVSLTAIPEDTDSVPTWHEQANISISVYDTSVISTVIINLTPLGGLVRNMTKISESGTWYLKTNAYPGSAIWDASNSTYQFHILQINATDYYGNWNITQVELSVWKNGDASGNGYVNLYDATYVARHLVGLPGYEIPVLGIAEVSGNGNLNLYDASYLARHLVGVPGYGELQ